MTTIALLAARRLRRLSEGSGESTQTFEFEHFTMETGWPEGDLSGATFRGCTFEGMRTRAHGDRPVRTPPMPSATFEHCRFVDCALYSEMDWSHARFVKCEFKAEKPDPIFGSQKKGGFLHVNLKAAVFKDCVFDPTFQVPVGSGAILHNCRIEPVPQTPPKVLAGKYGRYQMASDGRIVLNKGVREEGTHLVFHNGNEMLSALLKRRRAESPRGEMPVLQHLVFHKMNLSGMSLHGINILDCTFLDCDLSGVTKFDPYQCRFTSCDLSRTWSRSPTWQGRLGWSGSSMVGKPAEFESCTFRGNQFYGYSLGGTTWDDCTLVDVQFQSCHMEHVTFKSGSYHNVRFAGSNVDGMKALNGALNGGPQYADLTDASLATSSKDHEAAFAGLRGIKAGKTGWGAPLRWVFNEDFIIELE